MFSSFRKNLSETNQNSNSTASSPSTVPMYTQDDSFVHIDQDKNKPALSLKVIPLHDSIGLGSTQTSTQLCASLVARDLPDDDSKRAPVDIVVALDVSGSMNGSKLDLCKSTLSQLLRELSSSDRFGLVTFGSDVQVDIPSRKLTAMNKENALSKIKRLKTRGCTNLSGGIGMAAQELHSIEAPHEVRAVLLLTDGLANEGVSDKEGIVNLTKGCLVSNNETSSFIAIHCFGYGSDHDKDILREISQATQGGTYYYIGNDSDVSSAFGDALGGILSVVAQNACISLKISPEAAANGVSISTVKHDKATGNPDGSYSIAVGDVYAEESKDVFFEVSLSKEFNNAPVPHVIASVSYLDTINKKLFQSDNIVGSITRPLGKEVSPTNHHVLLQSIRIQTTEVIAEAERLAESSQLDDAKKVIKSQIANLEIQSTLFGPSNLYISQMISELNTIIAGLSSKRTYEAQGAMYMQSRLMSHQMQRCTESNENTPSYYRSSAKACRSNKMKQFAGTH
mmetsp:Transcript_12186/g.14172  ORF Transcript_12186/g.14172 Transcript_12186/m.14172 type:complete len:510 (-) Transcript_12186:183-1712(-)